MELLLTSQNDTSIFVHCNGLPSHSFDHQLLLPGSESSFFHPLQQPQAYGQAIYHALFPGGTLASQTLQKAKDTIRLVLSDPRLDVICWEYAYGPQGYLLLDYPFVRALPVELCIDPPVLAHLHIIAVPSHPLESSFPSLDIAGEWQRLKEIVQLVPSSLRLECTYPSTLEQLRRLTAHKQSCVVHFMGHGDFQESEAVLFFEQEDGSSHAISARQLQRSLPKTIFLLVLNACVSATSGLEHSSNIAASLVQQQIPYVLGMRFAISDDDARLFSRTFYSELAQGTSVEEAVRQVRLIFAERTSPSAIGIPILYTSLKTATSGFSLVKGSSSIDEHQPRFDISALSRPEGVFQGYQQEMLHLGKIFTADNRPRCITLHGMGGVGKTALAGAAAERFAYAWPGGVWAISMEHLPSRELVVADLARFRALSSQDGHIPQDLERQVLFHLSQQRTLLILDNMETLLEAVKASDGEALRLASFLRETLPPSVSFLVTSRSPLSWSNEVRIEVSGLLVEDGARFLSQHLSKRRDQITQEQARTLSRALGGHPLSLRLLATAFDENVSSFEDFLASYEEQLLSMASLYKEPDHRHRTLQACIAVSTNQLSDDERTMLHGLTLFHAPFSPESATTVLQHILAPNTPERQARLTVQNLQRLWQRGFLARGEHHSHWFYHLLPIIRLYAEQVMEHTALPENVFSSFGIIYAHQVTSIVEWMDDDPALIAFARLAIADFERGMEYVKGEVQAYYWLEWGRITHRLGNSKRGRELTEQALEFAQMQAHLSKLEGRALNNLADLYRTTGQQQKALQCYEQSLALWKRTGSRSGEAWTGNDIALIYKAQGQLQKALALHEQILPIRREVGDRRGEAITLSNMATIYQDMGQWQQALELCEQSLPIIRQVGDRNGESAILTTLALLAQHMGETERAHRLHTQVLHLKRAIGDRPGEAAALNNLSDIYRLTGQQQERLSTLKQALLIDQATGDRVAEATVLNNLAIAYSSMGQWQKALDLHEQVLPLRREGGDRKGEAITYNNLAFIFMERRETQQALAYLEQALSIVREIGYRSEEALILSSIGTAYQQRGQTQQAVAFYEQALPILHETKNREGEAILLTNYANIFIRSKDYQHGIKMLEQALIIQREIGHKAGEAATLNNLATIYCDRKQFHDALPLYEQVLKLHREGESPIDEAATLNNIATLYTEIGQPQRSIGLYEHAVLILQTMGNFNEATRLLSLADTYQKMGNRQKALDLFQQTLPLLKAEGDVTKEAKAHMHIASLYNHMGHMQQAIYSYQQALSLLQISEYQQEKASILAAMGHSYQNIGQLALALTHYEQALNIQRERHDVKEEANLLHTIAYLHQSMGKMGEALRLHEQALEIYRAREDHLGEAQTLNCVGEILRLTHNFEQALDLFQQALFIFHEYLDREGEAAVLNNMALVYRQTSQPLRALDLYEHVLSIWHKSGDRFNEAFVLNNMGAAYSVLGETETALKCYQQALHTRREIDHYAGASTTLCNMAMLYYQLLNNQQEALFHLEQAIALLVEYQLPCNTAQQTLAMLQELREKIQQGEPIEEQEVDHLVLSQDQLHDIINRTVTVMTVSQYQQASWREVLVGLSERVQQSGKVFQSEATLFTSLISLLDGDNSTLSGPHAYASTLDDIKVMLKQYQSEMPPFAADLIERSSVALTHGPQEKLAHLRYLLHEENQQADEEQRRLFQCISLTLVGADPLQLGHELQGIYHLAWETLLIAIETADADVHQLRLLRQSTLAALGKETHKRDEWSQLLLQMSYQAEAQGNQQLVLLLRKMIELLEADGKVIPSDQGLKGIYAYTWKDIVLYLSFF